MRRGWFRVVRLADFRPFHTFGVNAENGTYRRLSNLEENALESLHTPIGGLLAQTYGEAINTEKSIPHMMDLLVP